MFLILKAYNNLELFDITYLFTVYSMIYKLELIYYKKLYFVKDTLIEERRKSVVIYNIIYLQYRSAFILTLL